MHDTRCDNTPTHESAESRYAFVWCVVLAGWLISLSYCNVPARRPCSQFELPPDQTQVSRRTVDESRCVLVSVRAVFASLSHQHQLFSALVSLWTWTKKVCLFCFLRVVRRASVLLLQSLSWPNSVSTFWEPRHADFCERGTCVREEDLPDLFVCVCVLVVYKSYNCCSSWCCIFYYWLFWAER